MIVFTVAKHLATRAGILLTEYQPILNLTQSQEPDDPFPFETRSLLLVLKPMRQSVSTQISWVHLRVRQRLNGSVCAFADADTRSPELCVQVSNRDYGMTCLRDFRRAEKATGLERINTKLFNTKQRYSNQDYNFSYTKVMYIV